MIHRALMGSFERFIGILTEHYAGEFPLWLAPGAGGGAADRRPSRWTTRGEVAAQLARRLRVEVDDRTESVGRKIREAELRKVPYMLVVGDEEAEAGTVAVRRHRRGRPGRRRRSPSSPRAGAARARCGAAAEPRYTPGT